MYLPSLFRERVLVFNCEDGHSLCVECFIDYCRHQLSNRQFIQDPGGKGYTIRCPNGCTGSEVTEIHHFRLMGMNEVCVCVCVLCGEAEILLILVCARAVN